MLAEVVYGPAREPGFTRKQSLQRARSAMASWRIDQIRFASRDHKVDTSCTRDME